MSGVNQGANLGSDVYTSGTVAAAREAALLGCRAMAISQYVGRGREVESADDGVHLLDPADLLNVPDGVDHAGVPAVRVPDVVGRRAPALLLQELQDVLLIS